MHPLSYPPPPRGEADDDPFRPLEDAADPATLAWVEEERRLTEQVLSTVETRGEIRSRVADMWDYPKRGVPVERGGRWFQMRNTGLQAQSVLWVADGPAEEGRVLIDPNTMSAEGTVSVSSLGLSTDGELVAYATSEAGSDWMTWRVRRVADGEDLPDRLEWSKFSGAAWTHDSAGFFYSAAEPPPPGMELTAGTGGLRILHHRLGTDQADDEVVFEAPGEPEWVPSAEVTPDGRWLVVTVQRGTGTDTKLLVRDLTNPESPLVETGGAFEARDVVVAGDGDDLILFTDRGAERGRLVRGRPGSSPAEWQELLPESEDTLVEAHLYGGRLVCHYLHHAHSRLVVCDLAGRPEREVALPPYVSLAAGLTGSTVEGRPDSSLVQYQVVSFVESGAVWMHDLDGGSTTLLSPSGARFDPSAYTTEQVFVPSTGGARVPMFVVRRRDLPEGSATPVLLYGYGGFAVPVTPAFSVTFAAWLDRGGMLAVANLRGGGEYGRAWHDAGRLASKQNVFDDFAACARWLSSSPWSAPGRVAIFGGSNGGLLVGASITQHPELFGAAVADVGVFDMLRFHLYTIGWAWKSDYGDPDDPEDRRVLLSYSPLHNVRPGTCYPPTLLMTGDHDDRVVPSHSYKFAAALQEAQACEKPVLLRVETSAGHGLGKPTGKLIDEATDRLAFLEMALAASPTRT
ncbi:MAG TPA: prolyl oligopeptidase family serine peptidase [Acidimicrobiales bacterium]|nr:prolyl oligopeptidase family serine peptidase [Acidimicrobiales bacterium]